ncbi:PR domain zinc finger protein 10 isoform 9-T9 [Lycaon pictus]|uniref:PR domain zinc finger protein 10 isoform X35 n=1 Tax=Canis lupus familiaris TaxID=9615 RepID=UPI0006B3CF5D|nr:PR domain zinc finger protein 10 isoform X35 [Canis lupus familiaris]XP_025320690.1 PR domain zinc finger protein 10 isoform X6 [Canis lupus dingo]XP_038391570.1 PR domain zinc finger protein 10 isoform X27 [Canis lupus familiaris]|eukprot:XP_013968761.1 PR domain zinc finger protein 10 isoform X7 [Canis lupus familiaris]
MDPKDESSHVWPPSADHEESAAQVHFVPDAGTVAQIVYTDDQVRPPQQVVYTADGASYTSVDGPEHTLVYIHPVEAAQTLFTDPGQVAYVQQDATAQQASLPVHNQVLPSIEGVDGSDPLATLQNPLGRLEAKEEEDEDEDEDTEEDEEEDGEDTDLDDWEPDPPRPFDPHDLWCEECNNAHSSVCPKHGPLHPIPNRPVLTRARASLPLVLYIDRFLGGVFSKRRIPKRTQFGPVEGPLVRESELKDCYIHLKVSLDKGDRKDRDLHEDLWFELSDETLCNWMMFVRPAQNHLEQNLVAYQYGHHVYYTTIKNVEPKQELKVWYAASYAEFVNQKIHDISEEERKVLREQEKNWPCYECNRRFISSEQLQQHLNSHDEKLDVFSRTRGRGRGRGKRRFGPGRRPGRPPKFIRLEITSENGDKCDDGTQDLLHFSAKEQFDEAEPATLNGLDQPEQTTLPIPALPQDTQPSLEHEPETHSLHLQPQHEESVLPPQSALTADDMRRAKRIRVKKHVRSFHSEKIYQCTECDKAFCRPDKLRLHMLRHSDRKDFLCSTCGKQFKRKDKLREHMQRMHNPEREAKKADRISRSKTFKPRITSTDYDSFTFKCRLCMMGFRRRGMLVNHLSKRHPDMKIEEVPELTLPIIKPNRDYFCQYCDKVYKSASKRKAHILKNHPGAELPPSIRKLRPAGPGEPDPMLSTHTQLTGTIATPPVCCPHCSKQYSSKTKMVQHIRKKHPEYAQLPNTLHPPLTTAVISATPAVLTTDSATGETVVTTDLLTQAMTELSQTLTTDYRTSQGDYQRIQYIPVSQSTSGLQQPQHIQLQVVQVAPATSPHQSQQSTVDVGQLHDPQTYTQHAIQVQHIQVTEPTSSTPSSSQVAGQPLSPASQQSQQGLSPSHIQGGSSTPGQTLQQQQQGSSVQHTYLPNAWNSFRGYSSEIQMMTLPPGQFVITDSGVATPVTSGQVKAVTPGHYVLSESQPELEEKQASALSAGVQVPAASHSDLDPQTTSQQQPTQYIITTTTNGNGSSEVHITKP